jgi:hypothetical protein
MFTRRSMKTAVWSVLLLMIAFTGIGAEDCLESAKEAVETVQEEAENVAEQLAVGQDLKKTDKWLRQLQPNSEPYDWLKGTGFDSCDEADLVEVLRAEIDPQVTPGLTYRTYILNAIYEEELVHQAYRQFTPTYEPYARVMSGFLVGSTVDLPAGIAIEGIQELAPALGLGLSTLLLVKQIHDVKQTFDQIDKETYIIALGTYFRNRYFGDSTDYAWEDPARLIGLTDDVSKAPANEKEQMLKATRAYFEDLWPKYKDYGSPYYGLNDDLRRSNREGIKALLLSGLEKHRPGC